MANVAIVNYCNLKCRYCFADDMIQDDMKSMTMDDYKKALSFLSRTPKNHVGIIGGEPTLHPQFEEILKETNKYCKECNTTATLFTNGIELEKFMPYIGERIGILINCNGPQYQSPEVFEKQRKCLDHMDSLSWFENTPNGGAKANCGCNIHPGQTDYSYMWDIVDRYHLDHIRTSVVSPAACYEEWRKDKEGYYNMMKPIFLQFCEEAKKHSMHMENGMMIPGCRLSMDCGHIPTCYFTEEEKELVYSICDNVEQGFCEPVVDITPDFQATACFGSYETVDMRDFENLLELERYLLIKKSYPRVQANCTGKCTTCKKHKLLQCQGGCLGFAFAEAGE